MKVWSNGPGQVNKMFAMPIYGNNRTSGPVIGHLTSVPGFSITTK